MSREYKKRPTPPNYRKVVPDHSCYTCEHYDRYNTEECYLYNISHADYDNIGDSLSVHNICDSWKSCYDSD